MSNEASETCRGWAIEQFGQVDLGDARRTSRLVQMAAAACERPSGKVAAVFTSDSQREGAYDFLEGEYASVEEMVGGMAAATVQRGSGLPFVFVPTDGSSVTVVDRNQECDFGRIGSDDKGARGLKVIDAMAVDPHGVPVGLLALTWWARSSEPLPPRDSHARRVRPLEKRETRFWVKTVMAAAERLDEARIRGWFQIDREGDGRDLLLGLSGMQHWWTVRANADRSIELEGGDKDKLRARLTRQSIAGSYTLNVVARPGRQARAANMVVRVAQVLLRLRDKKTGRISRLPVTAVWALEQGTTPAREDPIDWLLYTNRPTDSFEDAKLVIWGYSQRWRIEEFHRTWKRGDCDVESSQLRSSGALQRWATILAAVAVRIERLKRLAREQPNEPAQVDLSPLEVRALKMLKFGANPPEREPTIAEAVAWLAELGGYANKYSGKPPGATVLGRGLKYLRPAARLLEMQHV